MERRQFIWPRTLGTALLITVAGTLAAQAQAQQQAAAANGNKYRVLIPTLEKDPQAKGNFGRDVAEELRKLIDAMPRHEAIPRKEMQENIKKFGLKEEDLNCVSNRQLASHMNAELVVCGRVAVSGSSFRLDSVKVIGTKTQEAFELQPITAVNAKEAAKQIFDQFTKMEAGLSQAAFCYEYLSSNQWQQAIDNCDAALKVNPASARAAMGKAFGLYSQAIATEPADQAKLTAAYELYKKVLENNYEHDAMRMAGIIAARLGLNEESRKYFAQYLELNPGDVSVRLQIASEQAKAGDHEGALKVVEEGLKTDTVNTDLLTWAGVFAAQAASRKEKGADQSLTPEAKALFETAAKHYKKLFELKNADVEPTLVPQMIATLVFLERYPEATDIGRRAASNPKTATGATLSALAQALAASGNSAEAVTVIDQAIAKNDTTVTGLRMRKAELLLRSGDLPGARSAFQEAVSSNEIPTDTAANRYWIVAIQDKWPKKDWDGTKTLMDAGKEFAQDQMIKAKLSWFGGLSYYQLGRGVTVDPTKVATARTALPLYTRALNLLEEGGVFARENPQYNYAQTIKSIQDYINYLNELIKRG